MIKVLINKELRLYHIFEHKMFRVYQEIEIWQANNRIKYKLPEKLSSWLDETGVDYFVEEYSLFVNIFLYNDEDVTKVYLAWRD